MPVWVLVIGRSFEGNRSHLPVLLATLDAGLDRKLADKQYMIPFEERQVLALSFEVDGTEHTTEFVPQVVADSSFAVDCKATKLSRPLPELEICLGMQQGRKYFGWCQMLSVAPLQLLADQCHGSHQQQIRRHKYRRTAS